MNQDDIDLLSTENLSRSNIYDFKNLIENGIDNEQRNLFNDSPYHDIEIDSKYYDIEDFIRIKNEQSNISLLSLNIQSLYQNLINLKIFTTNFVVIKVALILCVYKKFILLWMLIFII